MNHRHLLPDEIDKLLDGDAGAGAISSRAHLAECYACAARVQAAGAVVDTLESLPHFAPAGRLADRVMALVPVVVPAHVAARETVTRWVPRSRTVRVMAAALAIGVAGALSLALGWLLLRSDTALMVGGLLLDRVRDSIGAGARQLAAGLLGDAGVAGLQSAGPLAASFIVAGFVLSAVATVAGLRHLATVKTGRGS